MILALDIGGTKIAAGLVDPESWQVSQRRLLPTAAGEGGSAVLGRVLNLIGSYLAGGQFAAIGIATAGVVGGDGSIISATDLMPTWAGIQLGTAVADRTGLPVSVLNDVHAHAVGEARLGAGASAVRCLVAAVGTGVGGAIVHRGQVDRGAQGLAGHLGHMLHPAGTDLECSCGRRGHVEPACSGTGITRRYREIAPITGLVTGKEIDALAQGGDPTARRVFADAGRTLGEVLASCSNMVDPDLIVISGSVAQAGDYWWAGVRSGFRDQAMDLVGEVPLVRASLVDAALLGAAVTVQEY